MHGTSVTSLFQALNQATTRLISTVRTVIELDEETGLYYYGARYLDPKYSMWISTDPALGEYIPKAPIDEEAKKYNQNLPGMGGVFNHINSNLYEQAIDGFLSGIKDGFVDIGQGVINTIKHPIKTIKSNITESINQTLHPIKSAKDKLSAVQEILESDIYTFSYAIGKIATKAVVSVASAEAISAYTDNSLIVNSNSIQKINAKTGPKPKGTGRHNLKIEEVASKVSDGEIIAGGGRGYPPERLIKTPGGVKSGRRPDILVQKSDGTVYGINVGKTTSNGDPIKRELEAIKDLESAGVPMQFVPYDR